MGPRRFCLSPQGIGLGFGVATRDSVSTAALTWFHTATAKRATKKLRNKTKITDEQDHAKKSECPIREHWEEIFALCKLNSLLLNATGEVIESDGVWRVYEFIWQMDAILFASRAAGCAARSFTILSGKRICLH